MLDAPTAEEPAMHDYDVVIRIPIQVPDEREAHTEASDIQQALNESGYRGSTIDGIECTGPTEE